MYVHLQVVEWKYRGSEILSFRNRWMTFDLWDFSGEPGLEFVYSCFPCSQSLHLVVCDAREGVHNLATWLADIQVHTSKHTVVSHVLIFLFAHQSVSMARHIMNDCMWHVVVVGGAVFLGGPSGCDGGVHPHGPAQVTRGEGQIQEV